MKSEVYIGPLIERGGRFVYDTFSRAEGLRSSFRYARVEEARRDRRAMVAETERDPRAEVRVCETLGEFLRLVETASRDAGAKGEEDRRG